VKAYLGWCVAVVAMVLLGNWVANLDAPNIFAGVWVGMSIFFAPFFYDWAYNVGKTSDSWTHAKVPVRDGLEICYFKKRLVGWSCPYCGKRSDLTVICDPKVAEQSDGVHAHCDSCNNWSLVVLRMEPEVLSVRKDST